MELREFIALYIDDPDASEGHSCGDTDFNILHREFRPHTKSLILTFAHNNYKYFVKISDGGEETERKFSLEAKWYHSCIRASLFEKQSPKLLDHFYHDGKQVLILEHINESANLGELMVDGYIPENEFSSIAENIIKPMEISRNKSSCMKNTSDFALMKISEAHKAIKNSIIIFPDIPFDSKQYEKENNNALTSINDIFNDLTIQTKKLEDTNIHYTSRIHGDFHLGNMLIQPSHKIFFVDGKAYLHNAFIHDLGKLFLSSWWTIDAFHYNRNFSYSTLHQRLTLDLDMTTRYKIFHNNIINLLNKLFLDESFEAHLKQIYLYSACMFFSSLGYHTAYHDIFPPMAMHFISRYNRLKQMFFY